MSILARILATCAIVVFSVGPVSAATASNASTLVAQAATSAAVQGTVVDQTGAPITGATVTLTGKTTSTATSDATGKFTFSNLTPGLYSVSIMRAGYEPATNQTIALVAGETQMLSVQLHQQTLTSLRTIASVRSVGRGTFNTSTAAVNVVTAATFSQQSQPQVTHVLMQVPGVQISYPGSSANGASPGAISFPNVRNARSYETQSLIDGHPLFVGGFGDYVTSFLNSDVLGTVEVVKGPGAMVPQINGALGGTVNFRTKDPTYTVTPDYTFGVTNRGGSYFNIGVSDTLMNGKLGFVVDYAGNNDPSAFNGQQVYFNSFGGVTYNGGALFSANTSPTIPGTISKNPSITPLVACCQTIVGQLNTNSELVKLRYKLSGATTATVSYLGGQASADQNANTSNLTMTTFQPLTPGPKTPAYTGSLAPGTVLPVVFIHPGIYDYETNNEPIVQGEVSTTLGPDSLLFRAYHAGIQRLAYEGAPNPAVPETQTFNIWGNQTAAPGFNNPPLAFNGSSYTVKNYDSFRQTELDKLDGFSFEYTHPIGANSLTFAYDGNRGQSTSYSQSGASASTFKVPAQNVTVFQGSSQYFQTYLLRGNFELTRTVSGVLSLYSNQYQTTTNSSPTCTNDGTGCNFVVQQSSHFDGRVGLSWRPHPETAWRFAMGSSVVPPYLGLLTQANASSVSVGAGATFASLANKNPNLLPETGFGYDLGVDHRLHGNIYISSDIYLTNMFNGYFNQLTNSGLTCGTAPAGFCTGAGATPAIPIYYSETQNLSNARFEGFELSIRDQPNVGFGWILQGSTQRGYAYNLPANFYCNFPASVAKPCIPANYNQNLNIVAGQNFNGGSPSFLTGSVASTGIAAQNQSVPYLQGNITLDYRLKNGGFLLFGETLVGKNNSYNLPPFGIAFMSVNYPINHAVSIQIAGDNIFNAWPGLYPIAGGGLAIPLANGAQAATVGNVVGPSTWRFSLVKGIGPEPVTP